MKESYDEGVATHVGPESCDVARKGCVEALTGVRAGRVLSRESISSAVPTHSGMSEGHTARLDIARDERTARGHRPRARTETLCAGTGRSCVHPRRMAPRVVS